eukprot:TRINITY_DN12866_c0_g1_i2.p2 TRINITY_DN12866_c0_g1~~TRINITY_DN12866_c0_g1_i2.p2  ORF type:complete len:130 (-),score=12.30 TRINITY_DN12866_c0_g1_i2:50-439(-)
MHYWNNYETFTHSGLQKSLNKPYQFIQCIVNLSYKWQDSNELALYSIKSKLNDFTLEVRFSGKLFKLIFYLNVNSFSSPMYSASVSYTHLTLPTICSVQISVVAVSLKKKKQNKQIIERQKKPTEKSSK